MNKFILAQLASIKSELFKKYPLKTLAVFGSCARGEELEGSDIDLVVEFTHSVGMEFVDLSLELEKKLNRKVDLVSRNGLKERFFLKIQDELIYV